MTLAPRRVSAAAISEPMKPPPTTATRVPGATALCTAWKFIKQGGVSLDEEKISDFNYLLTLQKDEEKVLKVGKRNYGILKGV